MSSIRKGESASPLAAALLAVDTTGTARIILHDPQNSRFYQLHHLFVDAERNLYTAADTGSGIWKVSPNDKISRFFPPPNKDRSVLVGLGGDPFCLDQAGNVFAINSQQAEFTQVIKITAAGEDRSFGRRRLGPRRRPRGTGPLR